MNIGNTIPLSKEKVLTKPIDLLTFASDASFYRYVPEAVVQPETIFEVVKLFKWCRDNNSSLTFRAAGTSLAGQSQTNKILVDISKHFKTISIEENGNTARAGVGVVVGKVNDTLKPYGKKLGPDPASINACMIGGILANNSSGMSSGTHLNPYSTIKNIIFALPNGLIIDTADKNINELLAKHSNSIFSGLQSIRDEIYKSNALVEKIKNKYRIKNTIGYSLNSFLDYKYPVEILAHLMIGSEGTLGFISEATFDTIVDNKYKITGMLLFNDLISASKTLLPLKNLGALAIEIIDRISIRSIENINGIPTILKKLPNNGAVILFEFSLGTEDEITEKLRIIKELLNNYEYFSNPIMTTDEIEQTTIWKARKGLLTSVASNRNPGDSVIIEDLAFDIENIPYAINGLQEIFKRNGYDNIGIYGHGIDGNLHFVLSQSFKDEKDILKYKKLTDEIADFTINKYNGSLKAEHGTGRNMAPFIEMEWGSELYDIMKRIKLLIDPDNIMNPGVIINSDKEIHLKNIKILPLVDDIVDKCIECGFCEPKCPSKDLTLTPRKRIVALREIERQKESNPELYQLLKEDYKYYAIETCAVDGLCGTACPVEINTGDLVKKCRKEINSEKANKIALFITKHFSVFEHFTKTGLKFAIATEKLFGEKFLYKISNSLGKVTKISGFPKWNKWINKPANLPRTKITSAEAIYFPCCVTRIFGQDKETYSNQIEIMVDLAQKANIDLHIPEDITNYCCGMAFSSKGYKEAYKEMVNNTIEGMWKWSDEGRLPVVLDSSSCSYSLKSSFDALTTKNKEYFKSLQILDSIEFAYKYLIPNLKLKQTDDIVVLHPNCSVVKMNLQNQMYEIAKLCAKEVRIPINLGCCGFAGDRGFLYPELTHSATKPEAEEVLQINAMEHYSSNVTCEIGMSTATEKKYKSFLYLIEKANSK